MKAFTLNDSALDRFFEIRRVTREALSRRFSEGPKIKFKMKNAQLPMNNVEKTVVKKSKPEKIQDRALRFACAIMKLHEDLSRGTRAGKRLAGQILDSGTSIGANLHEADVAQSKADFIAKCCIALKEAKETQYWLKALSQTKGIATDRLLPLIGESSQIVAILVTIVKKARLSPSRGSKNSPGAP